MKKSSADVALRDNGVKEESIIDSIMKNYKIPFCDMEELLKK